MLSKRANSFRCAGRSYKCLSVEQKVVDGVVHEFDPARSARNVEYHILASRHHRGNQRILFMNLRE
jgi:hypothetical protein